MNLKSSIYSLLSSNHGVTAPRRSEASFDIDLMNMGATNGGTVPERYITALENAKNRWESIIDGGVPNRIASDYGIADWFRDYFGGSSGFDGEIDDLLIGYEFINDSSSKLKAQAGVSTRDGSRPIAGVFKVNIDWLTNEQFTDNDLTLVFTHVMGKFCSSRVLDVVLFAN